MKMKFKKYTTLFVLLLSLFLLVGCNDVTPNQDSVTLYLDSKFEGSINCEAPSFTFHFNGNLNTISNVNKTYYTVFSNNEDDILSEALTALFDQYKDKMSVEIVQTDNVTKRKYSHLDEKGKLYNVDMKCDDGKVYDETAYIMLENGLKLTVDYCRFVSDGKTYYTWRYSRSIAMYIYYPLMVINDNGTRKITLLTLPNRIQFKINPDQKLSGLLSKDTYLDESFYTFEYYNDENNESYDKVQYVLDYYQDYNLEKQEDNRYTFQYLNNLYQLKIQENNFVITWISAK